MSKDFRDKNGHFASEEDDGKKCWHEKTEQEKLADIEKKFIHDDGAQSNYTPELKHLLGEEFKGYKGQDAIDKLLKEKRGYVKGAFHRDDIGDIDLFWGSDTVGLQHIMKQRQKEKIGHETEIFSMLANTIDKGTKRDNSKTGNYELSYNKNNNTYRVIIAPSYQGNVITYVLTAFRRNK